MKKWIVKFLFYILIAIVLFVLSEISIRLIYKDKLKYVKSSLSLIDKYVWSISKMFIEKGEGQYETDLASFLIQPPSDFAVQFEFFKMPKKKGVYRIFCIGGSSVLGYPFSYNNVHSEITFPKKLQHMLDKDAVNLEIINAGVSGTYTGKLIPLTRELITYDPDAIILYAGHNEYGYYYWSPEILKIAPLTLKIDRLLNKLYLYRLLVRTLDKSPEVDRHSEKWFKYNIKSGLWKKEVVARILLDKFKDIVPSKEWQNFAANELFLCEELFEQNLLQINSILKKSGVTFIVCTVVSNIKDYPPIFSFHSSTFSPEDLEYWEKAYGNVKKLLTKQDYAEAINELLKLQKMDTAYAETYYLLGKAYYSLGKYSLARKNFILAKDYSPAYAPFQRAPSSLNHRIRKICRKNRIFLIDIEKEFYSLKTNFGIPGYDLFRDNLHPNENGYLFIAQIIANKIKQFKIIPEVLKK